MSLAWVELAARKIHENTTFSQGPFLSINCAAITETIRESELFVHVKGGLMYEAAIGGQKFSFEPL